MKQPTNEMSVFDQKIKRPQELEDADRMKGWGVPYSADLLQYLLEVAHLHISKKTITDVPRLGYSKAEWEQFQDDAACFARCFHRDLVLAEQAGHQ